MPSSDVSLLSAMAQSKIRLRMRATMNAPANAAPDQHLGPLGGRGAACGAGQRRSAAAASRGGGRGIRLGRGSRRPVTRRGARDAVPAGRSASASARRGRRRPARARARPRPRRLGLLARLRSLRESFSSFSCGRLGARRAPCAISSSARRASVSASSLRISAARTSARRVASLSRGGCGRCGCAAVGPRSLRRIFPEGAALNHGGHLRGRDRGEGAEAGEQARPDEALDHVVVGHGAAV